MVKELTAQTSVEALHLPRGSGTGGLGEPMGDGVVAADPIEQHLPALAEPIGELLAIIGEHFLGNPVAAERFGEGQAHRSPRCAHHHRGDDAEPGMVIDSGDDLALGPID